MPSVSVSAPKLGSKTGVRVHFTDESWTTPGFSDGLIFCHSNNKKKPVGFIFSKGSVAGK
jgi:hypothetical protein